MISRTASTWQRELASAIVRPGDLLERLGLAHDPCVTDGGAFPLRVPEGFVRRMRPGDPRDPLLRQVLPVSAEDAVLPGDSPDPVGDLAALVTPGLLRKYHGRALLILTGACPLHCRYCFRRHFPYSEEGLAGGWDRALARIASDRSVSEVILSGGDPLTLSDAKLERLVERLSGIAHLTRLRIHTRTPIVVPSRVSDRLVAWLARSRLATVVVLHANHPAEVDATVATATARLRETGATLLNQAVLLRGVNDSLEALVGLSERLFEVGVLPYYLHQLDRVQGAAHFAVDDVTAGRLVEGLRARLPGYLVPRLVREEAGRPFKVPLV